MRFVVAASPRASFALSSASDSTMTRQSFSTSTLHTAHPGAQTSSAPIFPCMRFKVSDSKGAEKTSRLRSISRYTLPVCHQIVQMLSTKGC